jgi:hypothetical protein
MKKIYTKSKYSALLLLLLLLLYLLYLKLYPGFRAQGHFLAKLNVSIEIPIGDN